MVTKQDIREERRNASGSWRGGDEVKGGTSLHATLFPGAVSISWRIRFESYSHCEARRFKWGLEQRQTLRVIFPMVFGSLFIVWQFLLCCSNKSLELLSFLRNTQRQLIIGASEYN